jgi:hypothetical protein
MASVLGMGTTIYPVGLAIHGRPEHGSPMEHAPEHEQVQRQQSPAGAIVFMPCSGGRQSPE